MAPGRASSSARSTTTSPGERLGPPRIASCRRVRHDPREGESPLDVACLVRGHAGQRLGATPVAEQEAVLITGTCSLLPYEAVRCAKSRSGLVVGISVGLCVDEHHGEYLSPV